GGTHTATFSIASGAYLDFTNGVHSINAPANFSGPGTWNVGGATVNLNVDQTIAATLDIYDGILTGPGNLNVTGTLPLEGGTLSGNGNRTISASATANIYKGNLNRSLDNYGTINFHPPFQLNSQFNNLVGGLITSDNNGVTVSGSGILNNAGTFRGGS